MKIETLPLNDCKVFHLDKKEDNRGWFVETFRRTWIDENLGDVDFIFDYQSLSREVGTIRGLHAQNALAPQAKLVSVLTGKIQDVFVDARKESSTYGQHYSIILSGDSPSFVYVPVGFYHGFITLEPNTIVQYKTSHYHSAKDEIGVIYNDPDLSINWSITTPTTISQRDLGHPTWNDSYKF